MAGEQEQGTESGKPQEGATGTEATEATEQGTTGSAGGEQSGQAAAATQETTEGAGGDGKTASFDDFVAGLGDAQKTLVKAEIERRDRDLRKANNEAKNLRDRAKAAEPKAAKYDEALDAQKSSEEKARERDDAQQQREQTLRRRLVSQEIRVQAADRFADTETPAELLATRVDELLDSESEPDKQAIADALDELLSKRPHLGRPDPKPRPPASTKAQGSSGNGTPSLDQQVAAARKSGDHETAMRLEMQKLALTPK